MNPNCLSRDRLRDFNLGRVSSDVERKIWEHLEQCEACSQAASNSDRDQDSFVQWLRTTRSESEAIHDAHYRQAKDRVQQLLCRDSSDIIHSDHKVPEVAGGADPAKQPANPAEPAEQHTLRIMQLRDYRLLRKIGEGGMGTVYLARHTRLDRVVALKILPPDRMTNARAVARFQQEMRAAGAFDHPSIVRATDAGDVDGTHFLVMEYVEGTDLSTLSRRLGPLPAAEACELIRQAALGLQHVHDRGMVHRDMKPSNLMLTPQGQVKILDLGLALLQDQTGNVDGLTTVGQLMGTLDYMAPEQADDSHEVDIRADVYSLGATLYRLLCGHPPFSGADFNSPLKKFKGLALMTVPPIGKHRPDIPQRLAQIVDRMLSKKPDDRYASLEEVAQALGPYTGDADLEQLLKSTEARSDDAAPSGQDSSHGDSIAAEKSDSQPAPSVLPQVQRSKSGWGKWTAILAVGLIALFAAGFTIYVQTDAGDLVIRSHVEDVEVVIRKADDVVKEWDLKQGSNRTTLRSGEYEIVLIGDTDGLQIKDNRFTLTRGDAHVATIERAPAGDELAIPTEPVREEVSDLNPKFAWQPLKIRLVDRDGHPLQGRAVIRGQTFLGGRINLEEDAADDGWVDFKKIPGGQYRLMVHLTDDPGKSISEPMGKQIVVGPSRPHDYTIVGPTSAADPVPFTFDIQPPEDLVDRDLYFIGRMSFRTHEYAGRVWTAGRQEPVTFLVGPDLTILGTVDVDAAMGTVTRPGEYTTSTFLDTIQPELLEAEVESVPAYDGNLLLAVYAPTSPVTEEQPIPVLKKITGVFSVPFRVSDEPRITVRVSADDPPNRRVSDYFARRRAVASEQEVEFWDEIRAGLETAADADEQAPADEMDLQEAGKIPVMFRGRVKPLDTFARDSLRIISNNRESFTTVNGERQPAIRWLLDVITERPEAEMHPVFYIPHPEVLDTLELEPRKDDHYSLAELLPNIAKFEEQVEQPRELQRQRQTDQLSLYQRKLLELDRRIHRYTLISASFRPLPFPKTPTEEDLRQDRDLITQTTLQIRRLMEAAPATERQLMDMEPPLAVPPAEEGQQWTAYGPAWNRMYIIEQSSLGMSIEEIRATGRRTNPATVALAAVFDAYAEDDVSGFNRAVANYNQLLAELRPEALNDQ